MGRLSAIRQLAPMVLKRSITGKQCAQKLRLNSLRRLQEAGRDSLRLGVPTNPKGIQPVENLAGACTKKDVPVAHTLSNPFSKKGSTNSADITDNLLLAFVLAQDKLSGASGMRVMV